MTNFSTLTNILLLGSICTLYSSIGGFKAIIWTDVFQFFLMVIGIGMVIAIGFYQNGGIIETLHTASNGGRLEMFDMSPSPFVQHTFFNTITMGFFIFLPVYTSDQVLFQRISSVKTLKNAKR
ncbi:Sodium-dependent multivitamin transporter [Armadillidium vulgare]|nr:Sodium-dependent multivitamin transporter [Armadillidium vulgare]